VYASAVKYDTLLCSKKSRQHPDFPGGHPPEYYPSLRMLNFAERTGYGVLSLRWPSTKGYLSQRYSYMTEQYRLCTKCTGYHAKTQLLPETCPSRGSYLLGTSLVTFYNWESIEIKNCAHRNLPNAWKFMHTTSRKTPPSPPRHLLSTRNHATDDRQTSSRHVHTGGACPQLLSASIIYPFRKAYRASVHTRQNAPKTAQLFPIDSHSVPTFGIV
jgi:hypothetical protein